MTGYGAPGGGGDATVVDDDDELRLRLAYEALSRAPLAVDADLRESVRERLATETHRRTRLRLSPRFCA